MKKLHLLFAGAFAAFAVVACSKDESEPEPEQGTEYDDIYYAEHASISSTDSRFTTTENGGEVHFKAEGGDVQVLVSCGTEWTVSNSNTVAFTAEITDTYYVTITAAQNLADEDLTGTVTLATAEMNIAFASIAVIQDGLGHITLSAEELSFPRTGGEMSVTVESESDWDCEYDSDWFTVVADTGAGTLTVVCELNTTGEVREGTVTVTAGDNSNNVTGATLTITQEDFETDALVLEYTITSDNTTIQLPLGEEAYSDGNEYSVDCTVDWGDGSEEQTVNSSWPSHTYSAGTYTVIINGTVELLEDYDNDYENGGYINGVECLTAVKQWGDLGLKSMCSAFDACTNLTSLPEGPGPFSDVTSFYSAFYECESLTAVPENMFSDCTAAENFKWIFYCCYNLTSAPSFKGLSNATDFSYAFYRCESLTTVPEDMFSGCTAVKDFSYVFEYCSMLVSAPSFNGLSNATTFYYAFARCQSMTTVPEDIFSGCTSAYDFGGVFDECVSLESVSVGIFDDNKLVTDFVYAFYSCSKLNGESPYTMIDGNKVHLYERKNYPDYFTAPTVYGNCFRGSTFDDIDTIPSTWGGNGASTNSVTPQSLNSTASEEVIPSHLGPQRDAARPHPTRK